MRVNEIQSPKKTKRTKIKNHFLKRRKNHLKEKKIIIMINLIIKKERPTNIE